MYRQTARTAYHGEPVLASAEERPGHARAGLYREPYSTRPILEVFADSVRVAVVGHRGKQTPRAPRGTIRGFSRKSRRRLMQTLTQIRAPGGGIEFLTLTYPAEFPSQFSAYKRDLERFLQALVRKSPGAGYVWKLEFQARGAPHFHVILFNFKPESSIRLKRSWVAATWYRIVASGDPRHARAGTRLDPVKSRKHLFAYISKYMSKPDDANGCSQTGRWWGYGGCLDTRPYVEVELSPAQYVQLKRLCRAWLRANRGVAGRRYARWIARANQGWCVFGLGIESQGLLTGQTVYKMLVSVGVSCSARSPPHAHVAP